MVSIPSDSREVNDVWLISSRFTGPKITLSEDELTDEQQEALKIEGLEINVEPHGTDGTQNAPISKDIERS